MNITLRCPRFLLAANYPLPTTHCPLLLGLLLTAWILSPALAQPASSAQTAKKDLAGAEWIWSPAFKKDHVPVGDCYFRKSFLASEMRRAEIHIAADSKYELFVNGKQIGKGEDWRAMDAVDLTPHLAVGKNTIAVHATNTDAGEAGLVVRVILQDKSGNHAEHSTDVTWRTSIHAGDGWTSPDFQDADWLPAKSFGPLGQALPWGNEVLLAALGTQFSMAHEDEFEVEQVLEEEDAGSAIAMAFNHQGDLLISREDGHLSLFRDTDGDGFPDESVTFCDKLKNVQGILPLGQQVFAIGDGPDGGALYSLRDTNHDGAADDVRAILTFRGSVGEYGPHAIRLGRDGLIYIMVGNHSQVDAEPAADSPYHHTYEGDLVRPRYEDPHNHAVGVSAPGGTIIRTDSGGTFVEFFAGGLRNAYDFAFLSDGELITCDADMEWDLGAPWYRPTRINHIPAGAELGWRSGWAKWPESYIDSLPAILDIGPGSPTGLETYDHVAYPARYRGAIFIADWAKGCIDVVRLKQKGASYQAAVEPFLQGVPLNVTDLAVGPNGALYFCTGGRGTAGGVYRVRYKGEIPQDETNLGEGIERALRQPQLDAPWAQSQIASVKQKLGNTWDEELKQVANDQQYKTAHRVRALDLMQLYGPRPSVEFLLDLTKDVKPSVRARATYLLGLSSNASQQPAMASRLAKLIEDQDARVCRIACETLVRGGIHISVAGLVDKLDDDDRFVRFAARRALEHEPAKAWRELVLNDPRTRTFLTGSIGLLTAAPDEATAVQVLNRCVRMIRGEVHDPRYPDGFLSDTDYGNLLRVAQIALLRGKIAPPPPRQIGRALTGAEQATLALASEMVLEYPTSSDSINRELVRLMVYLQIPDAARMFAKELASDDLPYAERLHIAAYASLLNTGWDRGSKMSMIEFLDDARTREGGYSVREYVEQFARQFLKSLTPEEQSQVLEAAADWPTTALSVLATLPVNPIAARLGQLRKLDGELAGLSGNPIARLRVGLIAVLGRSGEEASLEYLRSVYKNEPDRRVVVAMSLTQNPGNANWSVLVDSLKIVEDEVASEILATLTKSDRGPKDVGGAEGAAVYRNLILLGLRSREATAQGVVKLLEHWTGQIVAHDGKTAHDDLTAWQDWYTTQYPDAPPAVLPTASKGNKWSYNELLAFMQTAKGTDGDAVHGAEVFKKAFCGDCHRHGGNGKMIGPDLSTVARRFHTKEILESVVYPSYNVSDQYESELSAMPDGLLNTLTLDQVADLFAYMRSQPRTVNAKNPNGAKVSRQQ